jgi:hypothetical protein
MQDGFDNVAEDSIIKMNRANVKLLATTVADLLVTYGWCVLIHPFYGVFIKSAINCMGLFIVHHLHSWLIPNSPALRIKVLSA